MTKGKNRINRLIEYLQEQLNDGYLCSIGQERLKWWRKNGHKFANPLDAMKGWDGVQIHAFLDYMNFQYYLENQANDFVDVKDGFSTSVWDTANELDELINSIKNKKVHNLGSANMPSLASLRAAKKVFEKLDVWGDEVVANSVPSPTDKKALLKFLNKHSDVFYTAFDLLVGIPI